MTNPGIDFTSPTWRAIERHANAQIDTLRKKNDSPTMGALARGGCAWAAGLIDPGDSGVEASGQSELQLQCSDARGSRLADRLANLLTVKLPIHGAKQLLIEFDLSCCRDFELAQIEEGVYVCSKQQSILNGVRLFPEIWRNVGCLKHCFDLAAGHGTAIVVSHKQLASKYWLSFSAYHLAEYLLAAINKIAWGEGGDGFSF